VRDAGVLQSAVARPRNRFGYETKDWFELAATYAHGIVKNHPFVDGNKRVAFVAARVFLGLNGLDLRAPEEEVVLMTVGLAEGSVAVATYAAWLRKHSRPKRKAAARRRGRRQRG
jgi:death-on-curing protein